MEHQRRMLLFFTLSFSVMYLWTTIGIPYFYPDFGKPPAQQQQVDNGIDENDPSDAGSKTDGNNNEETDNKSSGSDPKKPTVVAEKEDPSPKKPPANLKLAKNPRQKITLGKAGHDSKNFISVDLSSRGAVLTALRLNDKRYPALNDRSQPLQLLGEVPGSSRLTFDMRVEAVDRLLNKIEPGLNLETVDWKVDQETLSPMQVTFSYLAPDQSIELLKTYQISEGNLSRKDADPSGYYLEVSLAFRNYTDREIDLKYDLQGPVGIPLENAENTRRYLAIQTGVLDNGTVRNEMTSAQNVAEQAEGGNIEKFQSAIKYAGVDGQYFAALLIPEENQAKTNWIAAVQPLLLKEHKDEAKSLVSILLESNPVLVPPKSIEKKYEEIVHKYKLYAGPKRDALLRPFGADSIIEYGWFGAISKVMLAVMMFFHKTLFAPYGVAIILLTVLVRGMMFPISRKHAKAAKKMKEMQPRFEEIRKKHENDKEKLAKAQMELMKESGFFSGCLPMLLQLPIFIGLYQALYTAVDLRMAPFLWIDNLAAPDHLFQMSFSIPWLGSYFNLLPILTVGLFVVQQKLFAPPPANEEQAMQQKMMGYMMIFIGFMFYRVPAGLCVYFIASSMWAIAERKMLDVGGTTDPKDTKNPDSEPSATNEQKKAESKSPKKSSWLQKKIEALDAAANPDKKATKPLSNANKKSKKGKKK